MKQMIRITIGALAVVLLIASPPLSAQTSTFIAVPGHSEEALTWCGAATGQMIIGGYPAGACTVLQADVWASIQANKAEATWDTDPAGLKAAMMDPAVCASSAHWSIFANTDPQQLMWSVAYWMKRMHYAAAAVLDTAGHSSIASHKEHWVVIKGIVTDLDPTTASTVNLQYVLIVDPSPASFGDPPLERFLSGSQWYSMFKTVTLGTSTYAGKYVALIEPPPTTGIAVAKRQPLIGKVIRPERAVAAAQRALLIDLRRAGVFDDMRELRPEMPLLVNPKRGGYYLVSFRGAKGSAMAVLINAYSGAFMEAARMKPRPILPRNEALSMARRFLRRDQAKNAEAALEAREGESPYFPTWRVALNGDEVLIDVAGNVRKAARNR